MRIAYISTYPPIECGLATYTSFLVEAMSSTPNELQIISQYGAEGDNVHQAYSPMDGDLSKKIFDMTVKVTPDIVHLQHEYGLYGEIDGIAVLDLIYRFKSTATPVVATLHTVHSEPQFRIKMILTTMCRELDAIIVHQKSHSELLQSVYGVPRSKIHVIPHGARDIPPVENAKVKLGLSGKKVALLVGYFRPTKCFDRIVDIFPRVVERCPDAWLVISGKMRVLEFSEYRNELFEKIAASPVKERIEVFRGQFPQKTFDTIVSASDVMVFPYSAGAQSGVMAHAFSFGKPVVTSDLPAFVDAVDESGAGLYAGSDDEYVDAIVKLFEDEKLYERCSAKALKHVKEKISWDIVARETLNVYKRFDVNFPRSRYIYEG
ncbi:MAG: glycosyltransferase [Kiritimatiellaeota bacterium]|nr:glycosyltransferase [Kiritimatiellota bacterium]